MKLWNYIILLVTMMIFLEFVGIPTGLSATLENFGISINPATANLITADLESSNFFDRIFGNTGVLIILLGGGAIIVGLFAKSYDTSLVILPLIVLIGTLFASTFWTIIKYTQALGQSWMTALIATIFVPLGIGFIWSCVEFFRGVD